MSVCDCVQVHKYTCISVYAWCACMHVCICIGTGFMCIFMCMSVFLCMYKEIYVIHTCMYACTHVCIHVCECVYTETCVCTYGQTGRTWCLVIDSWADG